MEPKKLYWEITWGDGAGFVCPATSEEVINALTMLAPDLNSALLQNWLGTTGEEAGLTIQINPVTLTDSEYESLGEWNGQYVRVVIESFGGTLNDRLIVLNDPINPRKTHPFRGKDYLQEAAEWVESYRKVVEGGK